jgi:cytochrome c-type biogenesis protein CcmF
MVPPYYNFFLKAFGLPLLLLMGIGPLVAWRRASLRSLGRTFLWPLGVSLAVGLVLLALGAGSSIPGLVAYTFSAFVLASIGLEFARGTRARKALGARTWPGAFSSLVGQNRRRYGGYVVHAAIVMLAIGIAGSSAYQTVREVSARPGETFRAGDYALTYRDLARRQAPNATETRATLAVERGGRDLGTLEAGKNRYPVERQTSNEVAIRSDLVTGEDLFVIADQIDPDGTVYFKVFVKPLINLIWLAGLLFLGGTLIALWPDAREQRRLALRYEGAEAPA